MSKAYHYVRFRWWNRLNLEPFAEELSESYDVTKLNFPRYEMDLTFRKDERDEYLVKSDTLTVFLAPFRAVLSQKHAASFTPRDLTLRDSVRELYPHERPIVLPWNYSKEPQFETVEK